MKRVLVLGLGMGLMLALSSVLAAGSGDEQISKEALQELNEYIGQWKGNGTIAGDDRTIWPEKADWGWRFKGKKAWLQLSIPDGKYFKGGELSFDPDEEEYLFQAETKSGEKQLFKGTKKRSRLILERVDPKTKETQQLSMSMAGGGVRFLYQYKVKPANRTLYSDRFMVAFTKEGESFGAAKKKVECIVTGGLGTIAVSYGGRTYYVCCSGCRDAFNADPAKYVAAAKKKR